MRLSTDAGQLTIPKKNRRTCFALGPAGRSPCRTERSTPLKLVEAEAPALRLPPYFSLHRIAQCSWAARYRRSCSPRPPPWRACGFSSRTTSRPTQRLQLLRSFSPRASPVVKLRPLVRSIAKVCSATLPPTFRISSTTSSSGANFPTPLACTSLEAVRGCATSDSNPAVEHTPLARRM